MNILMLEDDPAIAQGLRYSLESEGYTVTHCATVAQALEAVGAGRFDLCLLDLTLPDGSGYDVCKAIKAKDDTPVIFLTAFDDEVNVVMGLELGADDYISKPFRLRELMARIKTVLRRSKGAATEEIRISGLTVRMKEGKVLKNGQEVILTALEYKLLLTFLQNRGRVLSRNMLLESIWDVAGDFVSDNTLSVYIKRLRETRTTRWSRRSLRPCGAWATRWTNERGQTFSPRAGAGAGDQRPAYRRGLLAKHHHGHNLPGGLRGAAGNILPIHPQSNPRNSAAVRLPDHPGQRHGAAAGARQQPGRRAVPSGE